MLVLLLYVTGIHCYQSGFSVRLIVAETRCNYCCRTAVSPNGDISRKGRGQNKSKMIKRKKIKTNGKCWGSAAWSKMNK